MIASVAEFAALVEKAENGDGLSQSRIREDKSPEEVWQRILIERPDLAGAVLLNKHLTEAILRILAANPNINVRYCVAMRRALCRDLFEMLSKDPDDSVRNAIAWNKKAPLPILSMLADDRSAMVRESARKRLADLGIRCSQDC